MSIIDKFFNGGSARKNVPFGYDKRIVMPKSAQDTIPFYEVYDNGLFLTGVNTFTLIFAFSNIDYSLLRDREQEETYQRYQRLLNALPVEINFQEFIMNSSVNTAKLRNILISNNKEIPRDILDDYNKNLETYIAKSEDATSEKITLVAMSYTPNETVDNVNIMFRYYREMQNFYAAIGSETRQLMPEEVFAILYEYYHPFDNTEFLLPSDIYSRGGSIKNYIAPSMFAFRPKEVEIGNSYTRILYMARYDRTLDDEFIRDILDNNCKIVVSKHIKHIDKSEAQNRVKDNIYAHQGKIQARLEKNHKKGLNFVPYHWTERERELEDLQERFANEICGKKISDVIAKELTLKRSTSIIKGFTSQSGKTFDAKLTIKADNTIGFEFPERLKCPVCGKEMIKSSKGWVCTGYKNGCNFFIAGTICGKCITDTIATMLCANKRTRIINGFTSKSGKAFSAALIVKDGKIDFDFPAQSQKRSK